MSDGVPGCAGGARVRAAWERFVGGGDVSGVRPQVVQSWLRCRDEYQVDPLLEQAPMAVTDDHHPLEGDIVFIELGFCAASLEQELSGIGAIATVSDATGRILASWGDRTTLAGAATANLAPWFCWSESATGTNAIGTTLEAHGPVLIRGAEHWCRAFHDWSCGGAAVRDVVTREPIAVLTIASPGGGLPASAGGWLSHAVNRTQGTLRRRARDCGAELVTAYTQAKTRTGAAMAAVDTAGKVVIADDVASMLLGVPAATPAVDPTVRWNPGLPEVIGAARYASRHAARDPEWVGSTEIITDRGAPAAISIRPVFICGYLVGNLISFGSSEGEDLGLVRQADRTKPAADRPRRLVAMRGDRMVLLRLPEVAFAASEGSDVWLSTDEGRLRSTTQGLDRLDAELADCGFLRVHRGFVVNLSRVREVERRSSGELVLVMDDPETEMVPVSRRNAPAVRRALDL